MAGQLCRAQHGRAQAAAMWQLQLQQQLNTEQIAWAHRSSLVDRDRLCMHMQAAARVEGCGSDSLAAICRAGGGASQLVNNRVCLLPAMLTPAEHSNATHRTCTPRQRQHQAPLQQCGVHFNPPPNGTACSSSPQPSACTAPAAAPCTPSAGGGAPHGQGTAWPGSAARPQPGGTAVPGRCGGEQGWGCRFAFVRRPTGCWLV